jgi:hypothetical protein
MKVKLSNHLHTCLPVMLVVFLLFEISISVPWSEIHKLINSILNKVELPDQRKESTIVQTHKKGSKTDCSNYQLLTKFYPISFFQG